MVRALPAASARKKCGQRTLSGKTAFALRLAHGPPSPASRRESLSRGSDALDELSAISYFIQCFEAGEQPVARCSECRAHHDLEHSVVAVGGLRTGDIFVRNLVGVAMNFVYERLKIRGHTAAIGRGFADRRITFAPSLDGAP